MTQTIQRNNGLKRSMPCIDLNSMIVSNNNGVSSSLKNDSSSLFRLEQAAQKLLFDSVNEISILSSNNNNKRQRLFQSDDEESKDGYNSDCSDATPATAALERAMAETNASVDQLELSLNISAYFSSSNNFPSDNHWWMYDYESSNNMSKISPMLNTHNINRGHPSFHINDVTCVLSRLSTSSA